MTAEVDALAVKGPAGIEKNEHIVSITLDSELILILDGFPTLSPPHDLVSLELVLLYLLDHILILPIVLPLPHGYHNNIYLDFIIIKISLLFTKLFISASCLFLLSSSACLLRLHCLCTCSWYYFQPLLIQYRPNKTNSFRLPLLTILLFYLRSSFFQHP